MHNYAECSLGFKLTRYVSYRTEKEMRDDCRTSGNLSPIYKKSHLGLEDYLNQSSVDGLTMQNPCPAEHSICTINFAQVNNLITVWKRPFSQTLEEEVSSANVFTHFTDLVGQLVNETPLYFFSRG